MSIASNNIKQLRLKIGWSQGKVAKYLKISVPALSKIENGITDLNISRLEQIAKLFNVSSAQLLAKEKDLLNVESLIAMNQLRVKITEQEAEISKLQKKVIKLYEEIMEKN